MCAISRPASSRSIAAIASSPSRRTNTRFRIERSGPCVAREVARDETCRRPSGTPRSRSRRGAPSNTAEVARRETVRNSVRTGPLPPGRGDRSGASGLPARAAGCLRSAFEVTVSSYRVDSSLWITTPRAAFRAVPLPVPPRLVRPSECGKRCWAPRRIVAGARVDRIRVPVFGPGAPPRCW